MTVTDDGLANATFNCNQLTVNLWSVDAAGNLLQAFSPASAGTTVQITCTPNNFQVVATNVPAARLVRVVIRATPAQLDPLGGVLFENIATVAHASNAGVVTDNITGARRSALVGGDANGVVLPPPATTPPTAPATTTTIVAALPPVPAAEPVPAASPVLPATGSNHTMLYAGLFFLFSGAALMVVARRRDIGARHT